MKCKMPEEVVYRAVKEGILNIDRQGRVWRTASRRGTGWGAARVRLIHHSRRRAENNSGKYLQVSMMYNWVRTKAPAHRLVYLHFFGRIPPGFTINHKNGNKKDNRPKNLEAVTHSENLKHAYRTGLKDQHGESNPAAKLTDTQVMEIRRTYKLGGISQEALGNRFGVAFQTVSKIVRGERRRKQAGPTANYVSRRKHKNFRRSPNGRFSGRRFLS